MICPRCKKEHNETTKYCKECKIYIAKAMQKSRNKTNNSGKTIKTKTIKDTTKATINNNKKEYLIKLIIKATHRRSITQDESIKALKIINEL